MLCAPRELYPATGLREARTSTVQVLGGSDASCSISVDLGEGYSIVEDGLVANVKCAIALVVGMSDLDPIEG